LTDTEVVLLRRALIKQKRMRHVVDAESLVTDRYDGRRPVPAGLAESAGRLAKVDASDVHPVVPSSVCTTLCTFVCTYPCTSARTPTAAALRTF
jgi:hypothetical protein